MVDDVTPNTAYVDLKNGSPKLELGSELWSSDRQNSVGWWPGGVSWLGTMYAVAGTSTVGAGMELLAGENVNRRRGHCSRSLVVALIHTLVFHRLLPPLASPSHTPTHC